MHGEFPLVEVDHINGDGADNRASNLRLATSSQNNQNRRLSARNKTGVKGVFRVSRSWRVSVGVNGKYHIAHFAKFEDAVKHSIELRARLHGDFANDGRRAAAQA
jgi:hypothetical protein